MDNLELIRKVAGMNKEAANWGSYLSRAARLSRVAAKRGGRAISRNARRIADSQLAKDSIKATANQTLRDAGSSLAKPVKWFHRFSGNPAEQLSSWALKGGDKTKRSLDYINSLKNRGLTGAEIDAIKRDLGISKFRTFMNKGIADTKLGQKLGDKMPQFLRDQTIGGLTAKGIGYGATAGTIYGTGKLANRFLGGGKHPTPAQLQGYYGTGLSQEDVMNIFRSSPEYQRLLQQNPYYYNPGQTNNSEGSWYGY